MLLQILSLGFNIEMKPGTESGFFYFPNYFIAYYFEDGLTRLTTTWNGLVRDVSQVR